MCCRQVAQPVSHVMLDHMSSAGVMHGDSRRRGEEEVKHEKEKENIAAVHARYHNNRPSFLYCSLSASVTALDRLALVSIALDGPPLQGLNSPQLFCKKNGFFAFFSVKKA